MTTTIESREDSTTRRRLLFLCQNLPYPPHGGAAIRSYHTLRLLSHSFEITGMFFFRSAITSNREALQAARDGLGKYCKVRTYPIPQESSKARWLADHLRSLMERNVYTRYVYASRSFRSDLERELATGFDIAHVDSLDLSVYLDDLSRLPTGLAHHNVESKLLVRRARTESGIKKAYLEFQADLMKREEARYAPRVSVNTVVSEEDQRTFAKIAPEANFEVVPNGVDTTRFRPTGDPVKPDSLVFVGGYTWFPNRDGMRYFAKEILPILRRRKPDIEVVWVGRAEDRVRESYRREGIHMTGYVDDIRSFVGPASCFVVPLRVGGGTRLKILDAWALGKAVVSTPQGAEGLQLGNGHNILLADGAEAFADAVCRVLDDPELRLHLEESGRVTAETYYDWDVIGERLLSKYESLARGA